MTQLKDLVNHLFKRCAGGIEESLHYDGDELPELEWCDWQSTTDAVFLLAKEDWEGLQKHLFSMDLRDWFTEPAWNWMKENGSIPELREILVDEFEFED